MFSKRKQRIQVREIRCHASATAGELWTLVYWEASAASADISVTIKDASFLSSPAWGSRDLYGSIVAHISVLARSSLSSQFSL